MARAKPVSRPALALALAAVLAACASSARADDATLPRVPLKLAQTGFALRPPAQETVAFRGVAGQGADAGNPNSMVYVMPAGAGAVGLLAAILTHGAVSEASRRGAMTKQQEAADGVLAPYRDTLSRFSNRELMRRALDQLSSAGDKRLLAAGDSGASGWVLESAPVFSMTQDQGALVLDNAIVVRDTTLSDPVYQTVVRVVSDVHAEPDLQAMWLADGGRPLMQESVDLFAHSLHVVLKWLADAPAAAAAPHRTFRYAEGAAPKIERAQLIERACTRAVVRTLRGWLLSIPQSRPADDSAEEACKSAERYPS